ncbi:MAG TPA: hypothetical protein VFW00_10365 [Rhodocyclaceae bacterium]|nr:hypothetical protein [Rhodocyclaceae bacterium]
MTAIFVDTFTGSLSSSLADAFGGLLETLAGTLVADALVGNLVGGLAAAVLATAVVFLLVEAVLRPLTVSLARAVFDFCSAVLEAADLVAFAALVAGREALEDVVFDGAVFDGVLRGSFAFSLAMGSSG